jgi:MFS family permease
VVLLLLLAYSLSYADRMVMSLLIGPIKRDLGVSDVEVSLLIGFAFALFYIIMGVPFGFLADRVNRRNLIAAGIIVWSIAAGLCGVAGSFGTLFLARMAIGAGEATLSPSAYSLLSDYFPRERLGRAISVYVIGNPLGVGLALTLGSVFIAAVTKTPTVILAGMGEIASWRLVFVGLVVPGLVLSLLVFFTVAEPPRQGAVKRARDARNWNEVVKFMVSNRATFWCLLGGTSLLSAAVSGTVSWIPTFFIRTYGMTAAEVGFNYGLISGIAGVVGLLAGGILGDALVQRGGSDGHLRVMAWAAAAAAIPYVAAPLVPTSSLAYAALVLGGLATGMTSGVSATTVQLVTPGYLRGQVSSVYILTASIAGIGLGPTVVAAITDYGFANEAALRYSLAILAALTLPSAAILLFVGLPHYRRSLATTHAAERVSARLLP